MLKTKFTRKENTDSGLGLLLILLILGFYFKENLFFKIAIAVVIITMTFPVIIYPFTLLWLNLSDLLGKIMSKVILTVIFFVVVCPIAWARKIAGKDSLLLQQFKKSNHSVFIVRNHTYSKSDMINPF